MMARNLHQLGIYFYDDRYREISKYMLGHIKKMLSKDIGFLANWANLYLEQMVTTAEVAVVGDNAAELALQLKREYHPNFILAAVIRHRISRPFCRTSREIQKEML